MTKKSKQYKPKAIISRRMQKIVLPIFLLIGAGTVILTILSIIFILRPEQNAQNGVGADGFRAYVEDNGSLGVNSVVSKDQVVAALGDKAKSVSDADISKVFNLNGDRGQTLTFPFVRNDGKKASLYVDVKLYKNMQSQEDDHIYAATIDGGKVNGHSVYYKHALTIGSDREYHLIIVNGLKAYRFVIAQPAKNMLINEVAALAVLKRLAAEAKL